MALVKIKISGLFLLLFFFSCENTVNNKMIVGSWAGAEWLVEDKPSANDALHTFFTFDSTGAYTYEYGGNKEKGTYKVENDNLFTTPANELEMMVKIVKLTNDSLVFDMSRGGQKEQLTLLRK